MSTLIPVFEVLGWLNKFDSSHLSVTANRLTRRARDVSRSHQDVQQTLNHLQGVARATTDSLEKAEIWIHIAAVAYWCKWFSQAIHYAEKAVNSYQNDDHRSAVALWILGMPRWEILQNPIAYMNWNEARNCFRDRRIFFRHSRVEREWYKDRLRQMEIELATKPEEVFNWLNKPGFGVSKLTMPSEQLVDAIQNKIRQQVYPDVYSLMNDLQDIVKWSRELYEGPEAILVCGLAAYQMGNLSSAAELLEEAVTKFPSTKYNNHEQIIARWMLGAVEWKIKNDQKKTIDRWRRCINDLEDLRQYADQNNMQPQKKWYADRRSILQAAMHALVVDWEQSSGAFEK
jgi:tetratricopeptide (TPR) repeat protein